MDTIRSSFWLPPSLRQGLAAFWAPLKGYNYDPGYSVWKDISGNNNHGTLRGPVWEKTAWGYAPRFDGIDDYVSVPHSASIDSPRTVVAIAKAIFTPIGYRIIAGKFNSWYGFGVYGTSICMLNTNGSGVTRTAATVDMNKYVLLVYSNDANNNLVNSKFYYNNTGVRKEVSSNGLLGGGTNELIIGGGYSSNQYWGGNIVLTGIWSRAFTDSDVADLYNMLFRNLETPSLMDWDFSLDFSKWQNSSYLRLFM